MPCSLCEAAMVDYAVPGSLQQFAPDETVTVCTNCLTIESDAGDSTAEDLDAISEELPAGDAGVGVVLLVDLLDALATNRSEIEELVDQLEDEGSDPMLALDRLAEDPGLDPAVDIQRRSTQLQQLVL
ncbi:DUF6276 family protein [Salinarchaeum laminariae]|uniref:DUF6276 family protein n=1 Tax=Salinarchaeum laminariae TaxID=869888 RepID=UPI002174F783|nr:DUF6276 family protein [Salinarchaeum laminariae]